MEKCLLGQNDIPKVVKYMQIWKTIPIAVNDKNAAMRNKMNFFQNL